MEINICTKIKTIKAGLRFLRDKIGIDLLSGEIKEQAFLEALFYSDDFAGFLSIVSDKSVEELEELTPGEQIQLFNLFNESLKKNLGLENQS